MAKKDWVRVAEERSRTKPSSPSTTTSAPEPQQVEPGFLTPAQRRARMLEKAERHGQTTEAIAMISLVRTVEGFTNMGAIYAVPNRSQIDAEFARGAKSEGQARARVWKRLREQQKKLDYKMPREKGEYARPSDWERLFTALVVATQPEGAEDVFSIQSTADRVAFRKWAEEYGLNGDGLAHAAQVMREMYEAETRERFQPEKVISKIQAFTADQLDAIIRAGFRPEDTYIQDQQGSYIPMLVVADRFDPTERRLRDREIRERADLLIQALPPAATKLEQERMNEQQFRRATREYDHKQFSAVEPDRNSVASEMGIVGGIFATVKTDEGGATGFGYHGITQPDLLKVVPKDLVQTERGKPFVRHSDGKTVVLVDRWLGHKDGVQLMYEEEVVASPETRKIEQTATQKIADAVVYDKHDKIPSYVAYPKYVERPYYWDDVRWTYKNLIERRLPFLARVAGVDPTPIQRFSGEDSEKEWMHARIMATGVTADKQLKDLRERFILRLEDVYPEGKDRSALEQADQQYPESFKLGRSAFPVAYEWTTDQRFVEKAIVQVQGGDGYGSNARYLGDANASEIPVIGTAEYPATILFRYQKYDIFGPIKEDYPPSRFRELLERIEPQKQMIERRWIDFQHTETGRLRIPLTITPQDSFPTKEQIQFLLAPHEESVVFVTDRDGKEHRAYITLQYMKGDQYDLVYEKDQETAQKYLAYAREKHTELQAAAKVRAEMGGEALEQQLAPVRELERKINAYTEEFEKDNLVAFVLGRPPFYEDDQRRFNQALRENNYEYAKSILGNAIYDRKSKQDLIDLMRKVSALATELQKLGFDWQRFNVNKRGRGGEEEDYGGYGGRPDRDGFYPGDVKVYPHEIYLPSMGRKVGQLDTFRLRTHLPDFQRRLEYELEVWKLKKDKLRAEREGKKPEETGKPSPEVIRRGGYSEDEEDS